MSRYSYLPRNGGPMTHTRQTERKRREDDGLTAEDWARIALIRAQVERMDARRDKWEQRMARWLGILRRS